MKDSRSTNGVRTTHGGPLGHRGVTARHVVTVPYYEAEQAVRICLDDLIRRAFPRSLDSADRFDSLAVLRMRRWPRWVGVPVAFDVETARSRPGQVAHVRWHALRLARFFPVMQADVLIHLSRSAGTELVVEGSYKPPFGLLGALGDAVIGRFVARSTVQAFVDGLANALEAALGAARRPPASMACALKEVA